MRASRRCRGFLDIQNNDGAICFSQVFFCGFLDQLGGNFAKVRLDLVNVLRLVIEKDADRGIETARERMKTNSSDPAVVANLGAIARSHSRQAVPFLVTVAGNSSSSPNVRSQAVFWLGRHHADKEAVSRTFIEMLKDDDSAGLVAEALVRFNPVERRTTLDQIAQNQKPDRVAMLEKIYRSSRNLQVRAQVIQAAGPITDPEARTFLSDVFRNETEASMRREAAQALTTRKDVDVNVLLDILNSTQKQRTK